ncbi:MAG: succinate dehydrogenase [Chthonomonadales bacterium]|nr:succinate dehydrogenase [Chthonomonadales bacterium]
MAGYKANQIEAGRAPLETALRQDHWWLEPVLVVGSLTLFSIYALWRAWEGAYFSGLQALQSGASWAPAYLSPFYSPPVHEWFPHLAASMHISPAFFVLLFPLSFRATCYHCRRSYYRAFFLDPPACAMAEPCAQRRKAYTGESAFPFILQNLHRYALYAILVVVVFHFLHLYDACFVVHKDGSRHFGIGVGTLIFALDTALLSLYVFSCHSWRHLIGGGLNRMSAAPIRSMIWTVVSSLNTRHGLYFWLSLVTVGIADAYVRMVASGAITDFRII